MSHPSLSAKASHRLWRTYCDRVLGQDDERASFRALSPDEQTYYAAARLELEISSNGLELYFCNSASDLFAESLAALKRLGADAMVALLEEAAIVAFAGNVPVDSVDRAHSFCRESHDDVDQLCDELGDIEEELLVACGRLNERIVRFASERGLLAPFVDAPTATAEDTEVR